ncbi:hypothetical protein B0T24DRAFT_371677 [Lasiosphaeria ovina]|uniref:Uncharacterized protein n=1 Tax=Lasiosphaeria ovina TaxID=92902 RepID=A0AAE0JYX2_9PEZI|nr:hypothetical protein B0T24DRAFT_371677 [Lasiosphaeria ovina]
MENPAKLYVTLLSLNLGVARTAQRCTAPDVNDSGSSRSWSWSWRANNLSRLKLPSVVSITPYFSARPTRRATARSPFINCQVVRVSCRQAHMGTLCRPTFKRALGERVVLTIAKGSCYQYSSGSLHRIGGLSIGSQVVGTNTADQPGLPILIRGSVVLQITQVTLPDQSETLGKDNRLPR